MQRARAGGESWPRSNTPHHARLPNQHDSRTAVNSSTLSTPSQLVSMRAKASSASLNPRNMSFAKRSSTQLANASPTHHRTPPHNNTAPTNSHRHHSCHGVVHTQHAQHPFHKHAMPLTTLDTRARARHMCCAASIHPSRARPDQRQPSLPAALCSCSSARCASRASVIRLRNSELCVRSCVPTLFQSFSTLALNSM